ncbi:DUF4176 domain-containing protein [Alkalihalobacterium elongatum]|uniref:DUF4176 domain-containing protein n=1 Tax=Alkalihalobacterium elongatum TaxID=2675466 RepID=UPI001C1FA9BF|nr:DUF4176 domain-containing protein [Alkalihalobacterium elongatum]
MAKEINSLKLVVPTEFLPIGSVIKVDFIEQAIMIYGRKQQQAGTDKVWDYVACPFPQGHISEETNVFIDHESIEEVVFKGLETEGELELRERLKKAFE